MDASNAVCREFLSSVSLIDQFQCIVRFSPESTLVYASPRLVLLDQSVMERWLLESDMKYMQYDHELRE